MTLWEVAKTDRLYELPSWVFDYCTMPRFRSFPLVSGYHHILGKSEAKPNIKIDGQCKYTYSLPCSHHL